jgi:hypothetical protein
MNFENLKTAVVRSLRAVVIVFFCTLMVFSNAHPAVAFGTPGSDLTEGSAHLDKIQKNSERALKTEQDRSMKDYADTAEEGANEVQGGADINQMSRPDNSAGATTIQERVEEVLENVVGDKK